jgi:hypothetical protein
MESITDFGKIWLRGFMRPEYGLRIDKIYFVIGEGDSQSTKYALYNNYLFVTLYYPDKQIRVFRRFSLDLVPKSRGTLFNGFNNTKHSDIEAITYRDDGVEEFIGAKSDCVIGEDGSIDPIKIMLLTGWK